MPVKKKAYELTLEEAKVIEDWRQGKTVFGGDLWVKLSPKEGEVIELWRKIQFGAILVEFCRGEPTVSKILVEFRHGKIKEERNSALLLLPVLTSS